MRPVFLLLLFISAKAFAQPCDCNAAFAFAVQKIGTNYAGFQDKVNRETRPSYKVHTDSLQQQAKLPVNQTEATCIELIRTWKAFFKDGHVQAYTKGNNAGALDKDSIRNLYKASETVALTEASFKAYLQQQKALHPLEGIWRNEDGNYRVGIVKEGAILKAFVLKADSVYWMPGQVKMKLYSNGNNWRTDYYMGNHELQQKSLTINADNNAFSVDGLGQWLKIDAASGQILNQQYYAGSGVVQLRQLSKETLVLTIRSFSENYRHLIDSIVGANHLLLTSTPNLIIDVRGNGGGSDYSFQPLLTYLYTHPYQRVTSQTFCTDDNIDRYRRLGQMNVFTEAEKANFLKRATDMEQHKGTFWSSAPAYIDAEPQTVQAFPEKIAVMVDGGCASTTEQFLLDPVTNSRKTKIYGVPTAGVLDYANMDNFDIPGTNMGIGYATSRSRRVDLGKGIDNKGVKPQVTIGKEVADWVQFVKQELEKK